MTEKEEEMRNSKRELREAIVAGSVAFVCSAGAACTVGFLVGSQNYEAAGALTKALVKPAVFGLSAAAGEAAGGAVDRKVRKIFNVFYMLDDLIPDEDEDETEEEVEEEPKKKSKK